MCRFLGVVQGSRPRGTGGTPVSHSHPGCSATEDGLGSPSHAEYSSYFLFLGSGFWWEVDTALLRRKKSARHRAFALAERQLRLPTFPDHCPTPKPFSRATRKSGSFPDREVGGARPWTLSGCKGRRRSLRMTSRESTATIDPERFK